MSGESLYAIACEILQETNVFEKNVAEIKYTNSQGDSVSLLGTVKDCLSTYGHRFRGRSERNLQIIYDSIAKGMVAYLDGYSASYSFKLKTRRNFSEWLKAISATYSIEAPKIPKELSVDKKDADTGVAMLKLLHSRNGVTHDYIQDELDVSRRAVQKDLVKLSPSLYSGQSFDKEVYVPFKLGGQPLCAEISVLPPDSDAKGKRFYTRNSVHPIALQENILQLATLLKSLSHQYHDYSDDIAPLIAIDIWSQMSAYAQKKIITFFAFDDEKFSKFIKILQNECPDDHACAYRTERSLMGDVEMPIDQALPALMKVEGRTGVIAIKGKDPVGVKRIRPIATWDGSKCYEAVTTEGETITFKKGDIEFIEVD